MCNLKVINIIILNTITPNIIIIQSSSCSATCFLFQVSCGQIQMHQSILFWARWSGGCRGRWRTDSYEMQRLLQFKLNTVRTKWCENVQLSVVEQQEGQSPNPLTTPPFVSAVVQLAILKPATRGPCFGFIFGE